MAGRAEGEIEYMRAALALARRGQGYVEPNPMVGCVIVRGARIVGRGWHRRFGGPHAETIALKQAGRKARGATAYVTLEPCNHHGKTPPCTEAIIAAGVRRVVAAMKDPNRLVAGRGIRRLRAAGIDVSIGLLGDEAAELNAPFIIFHRERRPYVILKWAQSLDGKIATRSGDSKWITSKESRAHAHELRGRVDAVLVGIGTVFADDPALTCRSARPRRRAMRIVLDSQLRIAPSCQIVRSARETPAIIVTTLTPGDRPRSAQVLERSGCEILRVRSSRSGIDLRKLLSCLHDRGVTNLIVEGGSRVLGAFWDSGLTDEAQVYVAPLFIGGKMAEGPLGGLGACTMSEAGVPSRIVTQRFGPDTWYNLRFRRFERGAR